MENYYKYADNIEGWFDYKVLIPVLQEISKIQNNGNILEIGIHHGKAFISMLYLLRDNEEIVAIDIFEDQEHNIIKSGCGNKEIFLNNIKLIYNDDKIFNKIYILKTNSILLKPENLINYKNNLKYRIISIDGCHTKNATLIDINNSINILSDDGIIMIDDYFNNEWPGVRAAVDTFMNSNNNYKVFYLNSTKLILCHRNYYNKYINIFYDYENNYALIYSHKCYTSNVWLS
jgi:hypothetical protein